MTADEWRHVRDLDVQRIDARMDATDKEIEYLKRALDKRDKRLDELDAAQEAFKAERENNLKASRNVIIGALISLAVGVGLFLIQRGL